MKVAEELETKGCLWVNFKQNPRQIMSNRNIGRVLNIWKSLVQLPDMVPVSYLIYTYLGIWIYTMAHIRIWTL